jgi:uncharacterized protein YehS (DUF1456 family)
MFQNKNMTNNDILKKLRVALKLQDEDIIKILKLVDFNISKNELSALFRKDDHPNYKECGDQILRNFLNGLVIHLRGPMEKKPTPQIKPELKSNERTFHRKPDFKNEKRNKI